MGKIDVMGCLKDFYPIQCEGYVEVTFPVTIDVAYSLLTLRITPGDETYTISCNEDYFCETNGSTERYYNIFKKWDKSYHYGIQLKDEYIIYKEYENDYNPVVAISDFIRFFIKFDDFIMDNSVVGCEENFE